MSIHVYKTNGDVEELPDGKLSTLQKAVDGYIEFVRLQSGGALVVNEDGIAKRLPINPIIATAFGIRLLGNVVYAESIHEVCGGCSGCQAEDE